MSVDKKAADYANRVCEKDDNLLKIYEAYKDGWKDAQQPENIHSGIAIILFVIMGIIIALFIPVLLQSIFGIKVFAD